MPQRRGTGRRGQPGESTPSAEAGGHRHRAVPSADCGRRGRGRAVPGVPTKQAEALDPPRSGRSVEGRFKLNDGSVNARAQTSSLGDFALVLPAPPAPPTPISAADVPIFTGPEPEPPSTGDACRPRLGCALRRGAGGGGRCAGGRGDMEDEGGGPHPLAANLALGGRSPTAPTFAVAPLHLCESLRERGFLGSVVMMTASSRLSE